MLATHTAGVDPTPAEVVNWNNQVQNQPVTTWTRTLYNTYLNYDRIYRVYEIVMGTSINPITSLIQIGAVPIAKQTGSKQALQATIVATEALSAFINPVGWVTIKTLQCGAKIVIRAINTHVNHPELRDMVDIGVNFAAVKLSNPIEQNIRSIYESFRQASPSEEKESSDPEVRNPKRKREETEQPDQKFKEQRVSEIECIDIKQREIELERQKLLELELRDAKLRAKTEAIKQLSVNPQVLANNAYNAAQGKGLGGNKIQISLEASKQVNSLSISETDPYRNVHTFDSAQSGGKKHRNDHVVARMGELIEVVRQENAITLQQSAQNIAQQKTKLETLEKTYSPSCSTAESTLLNNSQSSESPLQFSSKEEAEAWIKKVYIDNENKAKELGVKNQRLARAKGVAEEVSKKLGYEFMDEELFHQIYSSMDDSDHRWFNDACGEVYKYLFGETTSNFKYHQKRDARKLWREVTRIPKQILTFISEHQEDNASPLNGNINSNGEAHLGLLNAQFRINPPRNPPSAQNEPREVPVAPKIILSAPEPTKPLPQSITPPVRAPVKISAEIPSTSSKQKHSSPTVASINDQFYTGASVIEKGLKKIDAVSGMEGLGSHLSRSIGLIANVIGFSDRATDQKYQQGPKAQQIGCAAFGTVVEGAGELSLEIPLAVLTPISSIVAAPGISKAAAMAGDDAQQTCHDVINMFKK